MKILLLALLLIGLYGCTNIQSQSIPKEQKEDAEFNRFMDKVKETNNETTLVQKAAENKQKEIIHKAAATITDLKVQVKTLTKKLRDAENELDLARSINTNNGKFNLKGASN
jgi:uncharacterized protein YceK